MIITDQFSIFLHRDFVDFRKSIDGLFSIVDSEFEVDLYQKCLFVFTNRKKDKLKYSIGIRPVLPFGISD